MSIHLAGLANHLWQSTLFVGLVWLAAKMLRRNSAAVRYWLWWSASIKFLVPFALLVALGAHFGWKSVPAVVQAPMVKLAEEIGQPFQFAAAENPLDSAPVQAAPAEPIVSAPAAGPAVVATPPRMRIVEWLPLILLAIWLGGVLIGMGCWVRWLMRMRALLRVASPLELEVPVQAVSLPMPIEPCVFGVLHPVLLLPEGIAERLTRAELSAVLAHELGHVQRRDNLTAAAHQLVETLFWFWPLLRWVRTRLLEERESACDEIVLRRGNEATVYAEGVLKVCRLYLAAQPAVAAGISGAHLKKRIEVIVNYHETLELSLMKRIALLAIALAVVAVPVLSGQMSTAPRIVEHSSTQMAAMLLQPVGEEVAGALLQSAAQTPEREASLSSEPPIQILSLQPGRPPLLLVQGVPQGCPLAEALSQYSGALRLRGAAGVMPAQCVTPYLKLSRITPKRLLQAAYEVQQDQIVGAPEWANAMPYEMSLKWNAKPTGEMWSPNDPRMKLEREKVFQPFLADYFKLTVHRERRTIPVYELVQAPGGVKLGGGIDPDGYREGIQVAVAGEQSGERYASGKLVARNMPIAEMVNLLAVQQGRTVVDHTGLAGRYDITLSMKLPEIQSWERAEEHSNALQRPLLYSMLEERFGLRLVASTASVEVVVVDRIEPPAGTTADMLDLNKIAQLEAQQDAADNEERDRQVQLMVRERIAQMRNSQDSK